MKKLLLMTATLLFLQANAAQAADIKPYAGIGLGVFELDPGASKKAKFGGFGFAGLDLHELFATEFRVGFASPQEREELGPLVESFKMNWFFSLLGKPKVEIADGVELYGLLGLTTMSTSITPANSFAQRSVTKTGVSFGLGGIYHYNSKLSVGMEWIRYATNAEAATKNTTIFKGLDVNGFTTTIAYHF